MRFTCSTGSRDIVALLLWTVTVLTSFSSLQDLPFTSQQVEGWGTTLRCLWQYARVGLDFEVAQLNYCRSIRQHHPIVSYLVFSQSLTLS